MYQQKHFSISSGLSKRQTLQRINIKAHSDQSISDDVQIPNETETGQTLFDKVIIEFEYMKPVEDSPGKPRGRGMADA